MLRIDVDAQGGQGHLKPAAARWPFVRTGDKLALEIKNPDFSHMRPLVLSVDNAPYRTFQDGMASLKRNQARYSASTPVPPRHVQKAHHNVRALVDRDPGTFWCWRGPKATLDLRMDVIGITQFPGEQGFWEQFERLVILNGAVGRAEQFGAAREMQVSLLDPAEGTEVVLGSYPLSRNPVKDHHDRMRSLTSVPSHEWSEHLGPSFPDVFVDGAVNEDHREVTAADRPRIRQQILRLRFQGTRSRASDENCVSEIYPLYNGG